MGAELVELRRPRIGSSHVTPAAEQPVRSPATSPAARRGCRILALVTDGYGVEGGIARYNADLMRALSQSEHIAEIVELPRFGQASATTPSKVRQIGPVPGRLQWSVRAGHLALRGRFDAIFCGHINAVPLAAGLAQATGARLWLQVHGIEAWEPRGRVIRRCTEAADLVTSVSRFTRARLLAWAGITPERVRVLPNTVGPEFTPLPRREDLVARHGLAGRKVIQTVGRLAAAEHYKGHDRVIRALPHVVAQHGRVSYLVVGSGDDRQRLEALARDVGVTDHIVFAGFVAAEELPDYFALADVYAMPSTGEGFGIVFLEAAACGLAVIGGSRDGSIDALADGCIGRAVDPDNAAELQSALVEALERSAGRDLLQLNAVRRFRFENFARHVDDLVGDLVAT